jgi:hypothetical protein
MDKNKSIITLSILRFFLFLFSNYFVDNPGVIQLKERCRAYDRRYVQCIFLAPTIARAFHNGFPRLYKFSEMNFEYDSKN